jgi:hypothetical protein
MATNLDERNRDFFLLKDANTPATLGPGHYTALLSRHENQEEMGKDCKTILEKARDKKPAFNMSSNRTDITQNNAGFVDKNPAPG